MFLIQREEEKTYTTDEQEYCPKLLKAMLSASKSYAPSS